MAAAAPERLRIALAGAVQGVGFRPFVYRLAREMGITGFVKNDGGGVLIEAEASAPMLRIFLDRLAEHAPRNAKVTARQVAAIAPRGDAGFAVVASAVEAAGTATIMADLAPCADCLREINDPADRRHRYPFISCVACGPRYSVIEALTYDRARTSLRHFPLCPACAAEYADPAARRFHAESMCCGACGPQLAL
ncbi:MAG: acylphosphatase [Acidibrevibacterium sp.]|uniref:acylphosphatase n=1 Tax=Acidibrevibacterium sp. TaxID=2606776 RepID=UPI003D029E71